MQRHACAMHAAGLPAGVLVRLGELLCDAQTPILDCAALLCTGT
jgi:hypothetical protein